MTESSVASRGYEYVRASEIMPGDVIAKGTKTGMCIAVIPSKNRIKFYVLYFQNQHIKKIVRYTQAPVMRLTSMRTSSCVPLSVSRSTCPRGWVKPSKHGVMHASRASVRNLRPGDLFVICNGGCTYLCLGIESEQGIKHKDLLAQWHWSSPITNTWS